jgi:RNA polymerase sigma-70 factor, ECF subfamily
MRNVLIDHARHRLYAKRGGQAQQVPIDDVSLEMSEQRADELVVLDEALSDLAKIDLRKASVVELRYFGGLSLEETAEVLGISMMTVRRDWRAAKAWLYRAVNGE